MSTEHTKGTVSKVKGKLEQAVGKVTGKKELEAKGTLRQVQGDAQKGLGDVQDAVRKPRKKS
jgi:uncharacterized protein YjbJ (UPF0337 family)